MRLTKEMITRLENYKAEDYIYDLGALGLEETWFRICGFVEKNKKSVPEFLDVKNFGELYEEALAFQDKNRKKNRGQYYTPDDVSQVMSRWLDACEGDAVCDVGCGTGNLILNYLEYIGSKRAVNLINSGKLYLYDADPIALEICKTAITVKFGAGLKKKINCICGDFLDASLRLPKNCKVIANPPYAEIKEIQSCWEQTDVLAQSKDFYAVFMEKVVKQAKSVVIITPFTFVSGNKYGYLRKEMCQNGNGFVVSFDNVPGNIFCGRKHGVFNSNTSNSVRAAITVFHKSAKKHGFQISPLLRFKTEEREKLLQCEVLENKLPATFQVVDETKPFQKVDRALEGLFEAWMQSSTHTVANLVSKEETPYFIDMPNTCRYFTTAGKRKLKRKGSISFYAKDEKSYYFLYCMINSGFAYWWWRIFDGAITFSHDLFFRMPLPYDLLKTGDRNFFKKTAQQMMQEEDNYIITKMNAGTVQENIKFPEKYRESINGRILEILGQPGDLGEDLLKIHSNSFFEEDTDD